MDNAVPNATDETWTLICPDTAEMVTVPRPMLGDHFTGRYTFSCPCGARHEITLAGAIGHR